MGSMTTKVFLKILFLGSITKIPLLDGSKLEFLGKQMSYE